MLWSTCEWRRKVNANGNKNKILSQDFAIYFRFNIFFMIKKQNKLYFFFFCYCLLQN